MVDYPMATVGTTSTRVRCRVRPAHQLQPRRAGVPELLVHLVAPRRASTRRSPPRRATGASTASSRGRRGPAMLLGEGDPPVQHRAVGRGAPHLERRLRHRRVDHPSRRRERALHRTGRRAADRPGDRRRDAHRQRQGVHRGDPPVRAGREPPPLGVGHRRPRPGAARTPRRGSRRSTDGRLRRARRLPRPPGATSPTPACRRTTAIPSASSARWPTGRRDRRPLGPGVVTVTGPDRLSLAELDHQSSRCLGLRAGGAPRPCCSTPRAASSTPPASSTTARPSGCWSTRRRRCARSPGSTSMRFMLRVELADRSADFATIGSSAIRRCRSPRRTPSRSIWHDPWTRRHAGRIELRQPGGASRLRLDAGAIAVLPPTPLPPWPRPTASPSRGSLAAEALRIAAWRPASRPRSTSGRSRTSSTGCARPCT